MLTSVLLGQRRVDRTMILTFWPCSQRDVAALLRALPFHFAGIQQHAGPAPGAHDGSERVVRKTLLGRLEAHDLKIAPSVWLLLHKNGEGAAAPVPTAAVPSGLVAHLHNQGVVDLFLPPRRSLVERVLAALVARGDTDPADDDKKTEWLVRRVGKLRPNEALALHWLDDRLLVRSCRRDELDGCNASMLVTGAPPFQTPALGATGPSPWAVHHFLDELPLVVPKKRA